MILVCLTINLHQFCFEIVLFFIHLPGEMRMRTKMTLTSILLLMANYLSAAQDTPPPPMPPPPPGLPVDGFLIALLFLGLIYGAIKSYNLSKS